MRIRNAVVISLVALISAITISITGQEEPLPIVRAKGALGETGEVTLVADARSGWRSEPELYLSVEPIHELTPITIAEAARNNDYVTFHEMYVRAQNRGEDVSQYQTLHELWSWAIADPIGAFYDRAMYDRLARAYPGYAAYIDEFRLVDRRGNAFFPTAETRTFLIERAMQGDVPRVMLAVAEEQEPQTALPKVQARVAVATSGVAAPALGRRGVTIEPVQSRKPAAEAAAAPQRLEAIIEPMAPPISIVATPDPVVITPPVVAPQPRQIAQAQPQPATVPFVPEPSNDMRNRGILLLIIGLLGTAILAVILRAPKEERRPIVDISDRVHPIRKQATPHADEHRASGWHG